MARRSLSRSLYKAASRANTVNAVASGSPRRVARLAVNRQKAKGLGRIGFWR